MRSIAVSVARPLVHRLQTPQLLAVCKISSNRVLCASADWVDGWVESVRGKYPLPDKYAPLDGSTPSVASVLDRAQTIAGERNRPSRAALHFAMRVCHDREELPVLRELLLLVQNKSMEISEEISLHYVKACCRAAGPYEALQALTDHTLRVGLWSNATGWNYVMDKLTGQGDALELAKELLPAAQSSEESEVSEGEEVSAESVSEESEDASESTTEEEEAAESSESSHVLAAKEVLATFNLMQAQRCPPNGHTYFLVTRAHMILGDAEAASATVSAARESGVLNQATEGLLTASQEDIQKMDLAFINATGDDADLIDEFALPH